MTGPYFAGPKDGDGCISVNKFTQNSNIERVVLVIDEVQTKSTDLLLELQLQYGGTLAVPVEGQYSWSV